MAGHHGVALLAVWALAATVLMAFAGVVLPSIGRVPRLPLWQLTPPAFAALSSIATVNRLPEAGATNVRLARLVWCAGLMCIGAGCAGVVAAVADLPNASLWTAMLIAHTFGAGVVLGRASVCVGMIGVAWVMAHLTRYATLDSPWTWSPDATGTTAAALAAVLVLAYARWGGGVHPRTPQDQP